MLLITSFIALLVADLAAGKSILINRSPVNLPISRRANFTSVHNLLKHDQARAKYLKAKGAVKASGDSFHEYSVINQVIENQAVGYIAAVGVGIPPTTYSLSIDTGSSNTWIGSGKAYKETSTSTQTSNNVSVGYGSGSFSGVEFTDTVTLAPGLIIKRQSIGIASTSQGFQDVDGILGIGPVELTLGTLSPAENTPIPTVTDNLFSEGVISSNEIGISFEPTTGLNKDDGVITWGGTDPTRFTGPISFIPLTTISPASAFWGIEQSVRYGAGTQILSSTSGIVDTGSTLVLLATDAFNRYKAATKGTPDDNTGLLKLPTSNFNALQSLFFTAGGHTFELTANAQIWPRSLNTNIGGVAGSIYLIVADLGSDAGEGIDFVNGFVFLQRFYSVYDTANRRLGLAETPFTKSTSN